MKGLAPHTRQIFEAVSKLDCIKPYLLVGGTALSLQIGTRQSEDSYSGHRLKSKNLLAMLTNGNRFTRDAHFEQLEPVYAVTTQEIEDYIKNLICDKQRYNSRDYSNSSILCFVLFV